MTWDEIQHDVDRGWAKLKADWARWRARRHDRIAAEDKAPAHSRHGSLKWAGGILGVLVIAIAVVLIFFDWNMLRGPIARYASHRLHRQVRIEGNLHVHLWSWTPRADVGGVHIANTKWAGGGDMADVGHLAISVRLWPLLSGHLRLPLVELDRSSFLYVRNLAGLSNWDFDKADFHRPLKLPAINRFLIDDARLQVIDARRKMRFAGTASSNESTTGRGKGFVLTGAGTLNGEGFSADVNGAPLLNVDQSRPYPFTMNLHAGYTHVTARGAVTHPFDLGALDVNATFAGRDVAELYYLTGLVLPNTPVYEASAHIVRDGEVFQISDLSGRLGHSDIAGAMTVDATGDKPLLQGELHSRRVYSDDLGFLFGGGRGRKVAVAAPATTRAAAASSPGIGLAGDTRPVAQSTLLLPDAPLDVDRVRQMNADVRYRAASIVSNDIPLRSLRVQVHLHDGVLRLDSLEAGLAQGTVSGHAKINASRKVPMTSLDLRLRDIKLQNLVHAVRGQPTIDGNLEARAILTAAGDSVHRAAANANGSLVFAIPHGEMRRAFAELLGINLLNGGIALLTGDQSQTNVRCAIAAFQARDGILRSQNITLDTDVERGAGNGWVNLKNETLGIAMSGEAKSFRLLRMNAPITLTGSLSHPKVGVQAVKALGQGGLLVALATFIHPLAGLLATIDPGLAKDANCGAVLAQAKQKGAPVSRRTIAAANPAMRRTPLRTTPTSARAVRQPR